MDRLQKKCLVTSATAHLALVTALLVGPAFISSKNPEQNMPLLDVIPSKLIDQALSGGGNPRAQPPPRRTVLARETAPPTAAPPRFPRPRPAAEPPNPQPHRQPQPEFQTPGAEPAPHRARRRHLPHRVSPNLEPIERSASAMSAARAREREQARHRRELAEAEARRQAEIGQTLQSLRNNLSRGVEVDVPGPGGEAYASYLQAVYTIYDRAWQLTGDITDNSLAVRAVVTIARDGTVVADQTRITRRSGNAVVDRSVQRALDRVKFVAPFPEGAKELERQFIINFDVGAKRLTG